MMPISHECSVLRLRIAPARIHFLKFILEGYDGLAIQSTIDQRNWLVELRYPPEMKQDLADLLNSLGPEIFQEQQP